MGIESKKNKFFSIFTLSFLFISLAFTGVISYFSILYDIKILKLWKEALVIFFISYFFLTIYRQKINIRVGSVFCIFLIFYAIYIAYNVIISNPIILIFYQIKNDVLVMTFAIFFYAYLCQFDFYYLKNIATKAIKIILILGIINACLGVLQELLFEQFLELMNFSGKWGSSTGLMIYISEGTVRPIGLQMGFVPYATICLLTFIILAENKLYRPPECIRYILLLFLSFAILYSHYATAMLGWLIYCSIFMVKRIMKYVHINSEDQKPVVYITFGFIFFIILITTNDYTVYSIVHDFFPDKADTSIYARVMTHLEILSDILSNPLTTLFGAGFGVYGAYNVDTSGLSAAIGLVATDSTYSYLLGNYGLVVTFFSILFLLVLIYKNRNDYIGITKFLLYIVIVEFFFNNCITDFPSNYIVIILTSINMRLSSITT